MSSRVARQATPSLRRFLLRRVNDAVFKVMHCVSRRTRGIFQFTAILVFILAQPSEFSLKSYRSSPSLSLSLSL